MDTKTEQSRYLTEVNLPESKFRFPQQANLSSPVADLAAALKKSLSNPVDYPPIEQSLFAGDQIAIALQADLPNPVAITQALVDQLSGMDFVIVCSPNTASMLADLGEVNGKLVVHDPTDENGLAMIGIDDKAAPVYVNRMLSDADVVIPIGAVAGPNETNTDCVYPYFSGMADRESFDARSPAKRESQICLANNQLGTFWGIQLVHGPGDKIYEIISGELGTATYNARKVMEELWQVHTSGDADLVVATIESSELQQNWDQFCAAVVSADQVAKSNAPIVICSEISATPSAKVQAALTQQFESHKKVKLNPIQKQVANIATERTLFLQSKLSAGKTEELGLGCVSSAKELQRLIDQHESGVLLRDAHRCNLTIQSSTP